MRRRCTRLLPVAWSVALLAHGAVQPPAALPAEKPYLPDHTTCKPQAISAAFRAHLLPFADQPEAVQQRLRLLQAEMTRNTLRSCVQQGLMSREQAEKTAVDLGVIQPQAPATSSPVRP